ncbi:MAG: ABC transporter ATP-binding protein [Ignavibacteriales bacterium]|nr:MAG: ABC transporter ATP-binding protein [Ignavibacteriaceae bacterium]MBW7871997.1 ABC transporter ATP-binding protein [Ignavibacteria bacterium]MCZ2144092.1 ABC transporter ATP-binding protein [Ignavibacteriales bacterium]MBV6446107.1 Lipoprotein-releasing system ATP-binding protein LolD [Ignavibacteriaceae bacterium]MBZ0197389.1 ABC transporter ATP-binding protein [Ignavibacteriaceae bacterium]
MENIIITDGLRKSYKVSKQNTLDVLKGVNISVPQNKISVIIGASGAGKSTLLHILGGIDTPDRGKVRIAGTDIFSLGQKKLSRFRNKNIGFVFQFHHLLPEFTALENIAIPMMIGGSSRKEAFNRAAELIEITGLSHRKDHKPAELSGGEQQRTALARALSNNPELILADEPTGNLDSANAKIINDLFIELRDKYKKSLVIVTHNKDLMAIGDNLIEMVDGVVVKNPATTG